MKLYLFILIYFLFGCDTFHNEIEKRFPIGSILDDSTFISSERFFEDDKYYILEINAFSETEYYEPYLLFYRKNDLKLEFLIYNPGKITHLKNKKVIGYYNEFKSKKTYKTLKNGYLFSFEREVPSKISTIQGGSIELDRVEDDSLYFKIINKEDEIKYHINQICFPSFNKNQIEIYNISDSILVYKEFDTDVKLIKESIWKSISR